MPEIVNSALESTEKYLEVLDAQPGGGQRQYSIRRIPGPPSRELYLGEARWMYVFRAEEGNLRIRADSQVQYVSHEAPGTRLDAFVKSYDRRSGRIRLAFNTEIASASGHITVDFKWLVHRVKDWLIRHGADVRELEDGPPTDAPSLDDLECWLGDNGDSLLKPFESQKRAMQNILSHTVSYTWGPPGSGKTKCVLATMANFLLDRGSRLLVLAPTNNALENALEAVIDLREKLGGEPRKILRRGFPSQEFQDKYPECCEMGNLQREMEERRDGLARVREELEKLRSLEGREDSLGNAREGKKKAEKRYQLALEDIETAKIGLDKVEAEEREWGRRLQTEEGSIQACEAELAALSLWQRLFSSKVRELRGRISQHETASGAIRREMQALAEQKNTAYTGLARAQGQEKEAADSVRIADKQIAALIEEIRSGRESLKITDTSQIQAREVELAKEARQLKDLLETLLESSKENLRSRSVIGMTLDAYIGFSEGGGFRSDWILLDEAGYAPIVKVLPIHASSTPKALFGDHKQLPPVCEADDRCSEVQSYWGQSCVFMEMAYDDPGGHEAIWGADDPPFHFLHTSELSETHRFGDELARILDEHVYDLGLQSVALEETEIWVREVVASGNGEPRVNLGEVDAVVEIVNGLLSSSAVQDIAVITPYKNQVKMIRGAFRTSSTLSEIDVLNTHQTQGREWDIVVFSAVDGTLPLCSPYYTNSTLRLGKRVLNTTLSRVKSQLILVVQTGFWRGRPHQLLGDLVEIARPWD